MEAWEHGRRFGAEQSTLAFERCDAKRERITRELMPSFECPFSRWRGRNDAEARDRGSNCVRGATGRVGLAANGFREDTPPGTGGGTGEGAEEGSPYLFRRYVDQNIVLVDPRESAVEGHRSIMATTATISSASADGARTRQGAATTSEEGF